MSKKPVLTEAEVVKIAGTAGARAALEAFDKAKEKARSENIDRRLRNTKLLLRNYRTLMEHCDNAIFDLNQIDESALDILSMMDNPLFDEDIYIASVKRTVERTYIMMTHVNSMLQLYAAACAASLKEEDQRRYSVLHDMYLADVPKSAAEIASEQNIDIRTVYKDIDAVVERLSALLFGIFGLNITD